MSKEHQEIWQLIQSFKYSEEESILLYDILTKEGFYTVAKLKDTLTCEDDLKQIGINQFEKRRAIYSSVKKDLDDNEPLSMSQTMTVSHENLELKHSYSTSDIKTDKKKKEKKDVRDTVESIKKLGSKIGRGAISRLFYALSLVKKRMIEYGMEGSIEAELEVAMFIYNIEVEINAENNSIEDEIKYLKEIENSDSQKNGEMDKDVVKSKEAKFSFIKKAIGKFLVSFRDHMTFMAEKMNKKNMNGTVGIGAGIGLGPIGSISIKPKIEIKTLMEWSKKNKELIKQRQNGNIIVRLIGGKELKKDNCQVVFRVGDNKRESGHLKTNNPTWDETFDALPCAPIGDELTIEILHKNKNIGKKLVEEIFVNVEKMKFENGVAKIVDFPLVTRGTLQVEFTFNGKDCSNYDGVMKVEALEGKKLAKKDITGKSDPYLIFFPGKIKSNKVNTKDKTLVKTKYISQTLNPTWNETVSFGIPTVKDGFTVFCYDFDMTGDHDFMGKVFVPHSDIKPGENVEKWLDLDLEGKIRIRFQYIPNK